MGALAIAYLSALGVLAVYGLHRLSLTIAFWRRGRVVGKAPPLVGEGDELPVVTVQLPLFNERYVARRLIAAVTALDWPRDRLHIQVLDDSTDDTRDICAAEVAALRARGFDAVHLWREDREGFKAGALAAGLLRARGELVLVLDADFVPPADFLRRAVGCFADPRVGMVQARWEHLNRDYSPLTRVQALLLDGHFAIEQQVRHRDGLFFNFNGTAGLWRRQAIDDAGGWSAGTLTEDLDLSYRALLRGWRFEYLPQLAAPAELPAHMNAFKSQQFRWAKGSVQVARKLLGPVMGAQLPWRTKVEAFFHLTQNVPYLITLVLAVLTVPVLVLAPETQPRWLELSLAAPLAVGTAGVLAGYCVASQWHRGPRRALSVLPWLPVLVAVTAGISVSQSRAVLEGAAGHQSPFVRTPKHGLVERGQPWWRRRYRGARTLIPVAEVALAIYFAAGSVIAVLAGAWSALPIVGLFAVGFGYVGVASAVGR